MRLSLILLLCSYAYLRKRRDLRGGLRWSLRWISVGDLREGSTCGIYGGINPYLRLVVTLIYVRDFQDKLLFRLTGESVGANTHIRKYTKTPTDEYAKRPRSTNLFS